MENVLQNQLSNTPIIVEINLQEKEGTNPRANSKEIRIAVSSE